MTRTWVDGASPFLSAANLNALETDVTTALGVPDAALAARVVTGATATALNATYAAYQNLARNPDVIISGAITRDSNGAATSAPVVWPNGTVGTYTADTVSTAFPGAVDGYHITYGSPVTKTFTQPTITRDSTGAAVTVPAIVIT